MLEVQVKRLTVRDLLTLEAAQDDVQSGRVSALITALEPLVSIRRDGSNIAVRELYVDELQQVIEQITASITPSKNSASG